MLLHHAEVCSYQSGTVWVVWKWSMRQISGACGRMYPSYCRYLNITRAFPPGILPEDTPRHLLCQHCSSKCAKCQFLHILNYKKNLDSMPASKTFFYGCKDNSRCPKNVTRQLQSLPCNEWWAEWSWCWSRAFPARLQGETVVFAQDYGWCHWQPCMFAILPWLRNQHRWHLSRISKPIASPDLIIAISR